MWALIGGALQAVKRVSWFRPALIGIVAAGLLSALGFSYMKGYSAGEANTLQAMNTAMADLLKRERETHRKDLKTALDAQENRELIKREISALPRPVGCVVSPECLRHYNNAVCSIQSHTSGANAGP